MLKRLAIASLLILLLPLQAAALNTEELLALVAMPLAVAAVSEITDVPANDLIDVVTLLNDAAVPPAQFIEVVRYVPVVLVVENNQPTFVEFVRVQQQQGLRGTQLVTVIEDRFRLIGVPAELNVIAPRIVEVDDDDFIPQIVRTRIAEVRAKRHPHGGPPGQLKKVAGVQTGAEIVHGTRQGRDRDDDDDDGRVTKQPKPKKQKAVRVDDDDDDDGRNRGRVAQPRQDRGGDDDRGKGGGKDKGKSGGKGKGKGKG